jgi:hypothetical protein
MDAHKEMPWEPKNWATCSNVTHWPRHDIAANRVRKSYLHGFVLFQIGSKRRSELCSVSATVRSYLSGGNATYSATVGRRKQGADLRGVTLQFQHASKINQTPMNTCWAKYAGKEGTAEA